MRDTIRIGQIPYLNCVLFFHELKNREGIRLEPLVPRALSGAARDAVVDAGPVPLVDTWALEERFMPLGDFCIATTERARSVFLLSKRPFEQLDGAEIGMTAESSTSVRLLKVLLANAWRVRPARFTAVNRAGNDAFLLIGDEALMHRRGLPDFPHVADLGEVWSKWTGLPFVFARWVVRRDLPDAQREYLIHALNQSLASGWSQLDRIAATYASALHMSIAEIREYLEGFRFVATDEEHRAMTKFRTLDAGTGGGNATPLAREEAR